MIGVIGASTRNVGTHMAVAEDGRVIGSLSGGCIEQAVIGEAIAAMHDGLPREISFGAGSRYIDIRLPCGGRIDLLITPCADRRMTDLVLPLIAAREPFELFLPRGAGVVRARLTYPRARLLCDEDHICVGHVPDLQLRILGHGASVTALARQALALGIETSLLSPDPLSISQAQRQGATVETLVTPNDTQPLTADQWTAIAFLFHDHDWETQLLSCALASPAFYVGAMGSYKTHAVRLEMLSAAGVSRADQARITAPIGLIASSRDPETLALSTLAQIVAAYHRLIAAQFLPNALSQA